MSNDYNYTWKHGISILSKHSLRFPQPLLSGMIFVDLLNGEAYRVHSLYMAKDFDRAGTTMPEEVVQTFPAGSITEDQLVGLRRKHRFEVTDALCPREEFAILDDATA
jgi:hypothetical protein